MASRSGLEPTVGIALVIAAMGALTAVLPGMWAVASGLSVPVLCVIALVLAIRRYRREVSARKSGVAGSGKSGSRARMGLDPTVAMALVIAAMGALTAVLPGMWRVAAGLSVPVLCAVGLVFAIRRYRRSVDAARRP